MSSWKKSKLTDVIDIIGGGTPKRSCDEYWNGDIPWLSVVDFNNGMRFISKSAETITQLGLEKSSTKLLKVNDLIISARGTVGCLAQLSIPMAFNQSCYGLRGKSEVIDNGFLYYFLKNNINELRQITHGAVFDTITRDTFERIDITYPSIEKQIELAKLLGNYDQKIQLNTQTNQTLEQIAQAMFKSWFVDFDPVKAKIDALANGGTKADAERAAMQVISGKTNAELTQMQQTNPEAYKTLEKTAALFPSEMVESELGDVPKGWGVTNFGSVSVCFDNQRIPLSKQQREKKKGSIPYYGATSIMDYVDEAIFNGIYLLMGEDGSVIKNDGTPFLQYIWGRSWINNHAHVLQGKGSVSTEHLMLFLSCTNISAYVTGAVQLKLNQKNMNSIPFLLATDDVNSLFYEKIKFLYEKIRANSEENDFLIKIRDSLLPKLLSGDLG
ncbi:restriction endonuclease subunit S [Pasteurella sp. PK-2025]|uniref:restriction endonuclease subunit S n=1 Tax=Pasteurella sp. PK-2025 TaxID=3413133 RepID=UPI003C745411